MNNILIMLTKSGLCFTVFVLTLQASQTKGKAVTEGTWELIFTYLKGYQSFLLFYLFFFIFFKGNRRTHFMKKFHP